MTNIWNQRSSIGLLIVVIFAVSALVCSGENLPVVSELLERYTKAVNCWDKRVSMRIHSEIDGISSDPADRTSRHTEMNLIHRRDGNRAEWLGSKKYFDDTEAKVLLYSEESVGILNGKECIIAKKNIGLDEVYGGMITQQNYEKNLRSCLEDYYNGGFLHGVTGGLREATDLAEFLGKSDNLRVLGKENINETTCYIIEGSTQFAIVTVWISPEKGYNALKVTMREPSGKWWALIDSIEVQKIDGIFVPVSGQFKLTNIMKGGFKRTISVKVKRSETDLNPDFESLGAFGIPLPDGSRIEDHDYPGIRYQVLDGKLITDVDKDAIAEFDRMAEKIMTEDLVPPGLATVKKTEVVPNAPAVLIDTQPKKQVDTAKGQEKVLSESRPYPLIILFLSAMVIIGIIAWRVSVLKR
jgi:hypothetical protein